MHKNSRKKQEKHRKFPPVYILKKREDLFEFSLKRIRFLCCHRGEMVGTTLLLRSLPEIFEEKYGSLLVLINEYDDDAEYWDVDSDIACPVSGINLSMSSSSLTTSNIDGRSSGLSWQHLRAKDINLSTHSEG